LGASGSVKKIGAIELRYNHIVHLKHL
jgi:hypothetical protein